MQAIQQNSTISYSTYIRKIRRKKYSLILQMIALLIQQTISWLADFDERLSSGNVKKIEVITIVGAGVILYFALLRLGLLS